MNLTNRHSQLIALNALALFIFASGCIVVVKEDDERRRYLHGSEWTLEVVFYRAQTMTLAEGSIELQFQDDGTIDGKAACGEFSGDFSVNENEGMTITSLTASASCQENEALSLVSSRLRAAQSYTVTERYLTISTPNEGYLSFSSK